MQDPYYNYWHDFFIKQYDWWREVFQRTRNPEAKKRANEMRACLYKKYLIELPLVTEEPQPAQVQQEAGQLLLF